MKYTYSAQSLRIMTEVAKVYLEDEFLLAEYSMSGSLQIVLLAISTRQTKVNRIIQWLVTLLSAQERGRFPCLSRNTKMAFSQQ